MPLNEASAGPVAGHGARGLDRLGSQNSPPHSTPRARVQYDRASLRGRGLRSIGEIVRDLFLTLALEWPADAEARQAGCVILLPGYHCLVLAGGHA